MLCVVYGLFFLFVRPPGLFEYFLLGDSAVLGARQSPAGGVAVERGARVRDCAPSRGKLLEVVFIVAYRNVPCVRQRSFYRCHSFDFSPLSFSSE